MGRVKEPIEGRYSVLGEEPKREPILLSWKNLWIFLAIFAVALGVRYWQLSSERDLRNRDLGEGASNTTRNATREQAPSGGAVQHLP